MDQSFLLKTQDWQDAVFKKTFTNPINIGIKPEKKEVFIDLHIKITYAFCACAVSLKWKLDF